MVETSPLKRTILIVDDDPDFRKALATSLALPNHQVSTAGDGHEALNIIQTNQIEVVISDIRMPRADGLELLEQVKIHSPHIPVILMVTDVAEFSATEARAKGAQAVFAKPINIGDMKYLVDRLLNPDPPRELAVDHLGPRLSAWLNFEGDEDQIETQLLSVGRRSVFVRLDQEFPNINDPVSFSIKCQNESVRGAGVVRSICTRAVPGLPASCSIDFSFLTESQRQKIQRMIKDL